MTRPQTKDKDALAYFAYLENKLKLYEDSPFLNSYMAIKKTIERWNDHLTKTEVSILDPAAKDVFGMVHKYMTELKPYVETLDFLRSKMLESEKKSMDEQLKSANWAERGAFEKK